MTRSNLARRVAAALVFVPSFAAAVWFGGVLLWVGTGLVVAVGSWEAYRLFRHRGIRPFLWPGVFMSVCLGLWPRAQGWPSLELPLLVFTIGTLCLALILRKDGGSLQDASATLFGALYVGFLGGSILWVRNLPVPHAPLLALTLLVSTWVMDACAYFAGKWLGRTRPFSRISPGKSIEGCIAGVVGAVGTLYVGFLGLESFRLRDVLVIGLIVGIGGQMGDFAESLLKRDSGVKDTSSFIPGHGGILDRFDSALFAFPLVYAYLTTRIGPW